MCREQEGLRTSADGLAQGFVWSGHRRTPHAHTRVGGRRETLVSLAFCRALEPWRPPVRIQECFLQASSQTRLSPQPQVSHHCTQCSTINRKKEAGVWGWVVYEYSVLLCWSF